jgi:hypothetical protein
LKGVIFSILEEFVIENWGAEAYEKILEGSQPVTQEPFVGPGTYPDEDLLTMVAQCVVRLDTPAPVVLRSFGRYLFHQLATKIPASMMDFSHPKCFLLSVEDIIHIEARKLYADADPPQFTYRDPGPNQLTIEDRSARRMYDLMEGLIDGVAEHFHSTIEFEREIRGQGPEGFCVYMPTFASQAA